MAIFNERPGSCNGLSLLFQERSRFSRDYTDRDWIEPIQVNGKAAFCAVFAPSNAVSWEPVTGYWVGSPLFATLGGNLLKQFWAAPGNGDQDQEIGNYGNITAFSSLS